MLSRWGAQLDAPHVVTSQTLALEDTAS